MYEQGKEARGLMQSVILACRWPDRLFDTPPVDKTIGSDFAQFVDRFGEGDFIGSRRGERLKENFTSAHHQTRMKEQTASLL